MEALYSTGHFQGYASPLNLSSSVDSLDNPLNSKEGIVALGVVLGSSISLVALAFAFITYSLFSDLRSLAGTTLLSLLATLFMIQLIFVISVGGIQESELCLTLSLAALFMRLASLAWTCCCCHHSLVVFRSNSNISLQPEKRMGKLFANYSLFAWGVPLLMITVAAAFIHKEHDAKMNIKSFYNLTNERHNGSNFHCWMLQGSSYIWGYLVPASILLFLGFYLFTQLSGSVKLTAAIQVNQSTRKKIINRRGLQTRLFLKILVIFTFINVVGAFAVITNNVFLLSIYAILQGLQGLVIAMIVTCNCKILRLYAQPRGINRRKKNYSSLREGEGGRFGVISVTNPNYEDINSSQSNSTDNEQNLIKMNYKMDENLSERFESAASSGEVISDLSSAVKEVVRTSTPDIV